VTVTICGPALPPGPVAVSEYVVVALTGTVAEPVVGRGPESSPTGIVGVIVMEVAFVVPHVIVVVCPALTAVGFAVNCVICGVMAGGAFVEFPHDVEPHIAPMRTPQEIQRNLSLIIGKCFVYPSEDPELRCGGELALLLMNFAGGLIRYTKTRSPPRTRRFTKDACEIVSSLLATLVVD
jgi:hypothetical protein